MRLPNALASFRSPAANLALAMAITGSVGAFAVESGEAPITVVFWRCVFGTLFLLGWCALRGYLRRDAMTRRGLWLTLGVSLCIVLNWIAFFSSFGMTTIATTTIVYHIQPFLIVLIGVIFLGEKVTALQLVWIFGAFIGVVLSSGLTEDLPADKPLWHVGIALTLLAALFYAVSTILAKQLRNQRPEITALVQTLTGVVLLAPFANYAIPAGAWGWLIGIGLFHTGIAYVLMYSAYPKLSTPVIAILSFIYPLVAIVLDWAVFHHPISTIQAIGLGILASCTIGFRLFSTGFGQKTPVR